MREQYLSTSLFGRQLMSSLFPSSLRTLYEQLIPLIYSSPLKWLLARQHLTSHDIIPRSIFFLFGFFRWNMSKKTNSSLEYFQTNNSEIIFMVKYFAPNIHNGIVHLTIAVIRLLPTSVGVSNKQGNINSLKLLKIPWSVTIVKLTLFPPPSTQFALIATFSVTHVLISFSSPRFRALTV